MSINYTSYILYTFVFIVRLISIPNVYFPNLIFISLLKSYSCSCAQDLKHDWIQWCIFKFEHHNDFFFHTERRSVYPCDDAHSAVVRWARVRERESGARKMNFLFVARRLDSLCGNFEGTPSHHLTRHITHTCVPYPCGRSRSSPKRD